MLHHKISCVVVDAVELTLVILAAGMGARYCGLKQLDAVGPHGETLLDYAVADAARGGFERVLFVIREDFDAEFRVQVGVKYEGKIRVDYVFQSIEALPTGFQPPLERRRPWGTGHAVWCARAALDGPFAVINADDFYGRDSFRQLAEFLRRNAGSGRAQFAMVGFELTKTLSEFGAVSRGICKVAGDGLLRELVEQTGIRGEDVGPGRQFGGDEIVSMNCWGFTPALLPMLEDRLVSFLRLHGRDLSREFYLPAAVSGMIAERRAAVRVLPTQASWFGMTYRQDKPRVTAAIGELVRAGETSAATLSTVRTEVVQ